MMKSIRTTLLLVVLLVVQVATILQYELVTKYIVSMRNHGGYRAPTYISSTTILSGSDLSDKYFQHPISECIDDDGKENISVAAASYFTRNIKENHDTNLDCSD